MAEDLPGKSSIQIAAGYWTVDGIDYRPSATTGIAEFPDMLTGQTVIFSWAEGVSGRLTYVGNHQKLLLNGEPLLPDTLLSSDGSMPYTLQQPTSVGGTYDLSVDWSDEQTQGFVKSIGATGTLKGHLNITGNGEDP